MAEQQLKLTHDFFITAGKAYIKYLDKIFSPFEQFVGAKFPISIRNTGDEVFLTNWNTGATKDSTDLYQSVPRMDIDVQGISLLPDQMTNPINVGRLVVENQLGFQESRAHEVRRMPVEWVFGTSIKFNDVIEFLAYVDIMLTVSFHDHTFSFYYLGTEYTGTFYIPIDFDAVKNLTLGYDTEKRNRVLEIPFALQLQFPAFNFYKVGEPGDLTYQGFSKTETMQTLIHNMHVNDVSEDGIISTMNITKDTNE